MSNDKMRIAFQVLFGYPMSDDFESETFARGYQAAINEPCAALSDKPVQGVDGWKLVPVVPTPEMIERSCESSAGAAWPDEYGHIAQNIRREQEATTANHTIAEIYQAVTGKKGEPGNWNGAVPVIAKLADMDQQLAEVVEYAGKLQAHLKEYATQIDWFPSSEHSSWRLCYNSSARDGHGYEAAKQALALPLPKAMQE
jgi:hypothetical protein